MIFDVSWFQQRGLVWVRGFEEEALDGKVWFTGVFRALNAAAVCYTIALISRNSHALSPFPSRVVEAIFDLLEGSDVVAIFLILGLGVVLLIVGEGVDDQQDSSMLWLFLRGFLELLDTHHVDNENHGDHVGHLAAEFLGQLNKGFLIGEVTLNERDSLSLSAVDEFLEQGVHLFVDSDELSKVSQGTNDLPELTTAARDENPWLVFSSQEQGSNYGF